MDFADVDPSASEVSRSFSSAGPYRRSGKSHEQAPVPEDQWFDLYCPIRNVTAKYPPAFLIHGTDDTDVPYAESKNMAARLAEASVAHEFITVTGAGHGLSGAQPDKVARIARQAVDFIKTHTG